MDETLTPAENVETYTLFFEIEVALREFIISELKGRFGARWWIERLPGDVLGSCREGRRIERETKWAMLVPHHPLYYAHFADLKKVIEKKDNWRDVFKERLGRQDILTASLSELEPIRNKIAHSRKVSKGELELVKSGRDKLRAFIGEQEFEALVTHLTEATDLASSLLELRSEASNAFDSCKAIQRLDELPTWSRVHQAWWFAAEYLDHPVDEIENLFGAFVDYQSHPRNRGTGHVLERWVRKADLEAMFQRAEREFEALLSQ